MPELAKTLGAELKAEFSRLHPRNFVLVVRFLGGQKRSLAVAAVLFLAFHQAYFWTGRHYMFAEVLYPTDVLFGWDTPRVVDDMLVPGHNARSNVHPLFVLFAKPLAAVYHDALGLTKHTSAIAVVSMMAAIAVVLVFIYLRLWGCALPESTLFAAIFGASTINYLSGVVPETGVFAICALLILFLLAQLAFLHGRRSYLAWVISGVFTYGMTISHVVKNFIGLALAESTPGPPGRAAARTVLYCAVVVALAGALTFASGSSFNLLADTWVVAPAERGGHLDSIFLRLTRTFFIYGLVGPSPSVAVVNFQDILIEKKVVSFNAASYSLGPLLLAGAWGVILAASAGLALTRRRPGEGRILALISFCVLWDFALFSRYYVPFEGLFHWSAHIIAPIFVLTAFGARRLSGLERSRRAPIFIALLVFLIAQAANNFRVAMQCVRLLTE